MIIFVKKLFRYLILKYKIFYKRYLHCFTNRKKSNKKCFSILYTKILLSLNLITLLVSFKADNKNPKVSIFLSIYNKGNFLNRSLNSIKEQTLKDIEIIAVNDFSTDNTLKILKEFSYKDRRIKIINNDRNHGTLYSRAMGILNCTGEYLINMDSDDKLSNENDLKRLYKIAKKYKSDFIEYELKRIYSFKDENFRIYKKLLNYKVSSTKKDIEELITNKFIKREIILKSYKYFEKYIYIYILKISQIL